MKHKFEPVQALFQESKSGFAFFRAYQLDSPKRASVHIKQNQTLINGSIRVKLEFDRVSIREIFRLVILKLYNIVFNLYGLLNLVKHVYSVF